MIGSGYSAVCLSLILLISPVASREVAVEASSQASLDSAISNFVDDVGVESLANSTLAELCASAGAASNSTVSLGVTIQGQGCAPPPLASVASASLAIGLPGRTVVIEAWLARQ